jgi:hypothetical protein
MTRFCVAKIGRDRLVGCDGQKQLEAKPLTGIAEVRREPKIVSKEVN